MRALQASRQRHANSPAATGVPPVPPEDSPKADHWKDLASANGHPRERMDVRQSITERIVAMLEQVGNVFRERWTRAATRGMPRNGKTGAPYHGANVLLLWDAAIEHGYASNVWLTYKQAASLGAQVRRGERAVLCAHFERMSAPASDGTVQSVLEGGERGGRVCPDEPDKGTRAGALWCRPFWLFNVAQIDNLPPELIDACGEVVVATFGPVEAAFRLLGGSGAAIRHGFEQAMYVPALDEIRLPWPKRFTSAEAYCATALHELVHWTGHPDRLGRTFGLRFGDNAYAFEELVAELGSAFAMGHCGLVNASIEGHAAYLDSWLQVLRNDRTAIFTAARHAGEAFEFILAREMPALEGPPALPTEV